MEAVKAIMSVFEIAPVGREVIQDSIDSGMADFEDALQAFSGQRAGATHIVSRDASGFVAAPLPSMSPDELLRLLASRS